MGVLRMYKKFKKLYENEFDKSGMKHVKGNIMADTFDNVITRLNSLLHGENTSRPRLSSSSGDPTPRRMIGTRGSTTSAGVKGDIGTTRTTSTFSTSVLWKFQRWKSCPQRRGHD